MMTKLHIISVILDMMKLSTSRKSLSAGANSSLQYGSELFTRASSFSWLVKRLLAYARNIETIR